MPAIGHSDSRVWAYNIALAKELAGVGFDEIQFDYVRFPSDGDLSAIFYPNTEEGLHLFHPKYSPTPPGPFCSRRA